MLITNEKKDETQRLFLEHNVFIVWKPEYNLGIPILDEHHRGIVTIINSLHFGMQNNYIKDILNPIIEMMHDYVRIHFRIEEDFHKQMDYPEANKHHEFHQELTSMLTKLGKSSLMDKDSHQFMDFLKKWWISHICNEDMLFRKWCQAPF
ncbi:MAG: hemerythrin family protein [Treponema sp.]|nr:hemerythrin family protein [Treponema sp.]